jgi:hypothetical protein
VHAALVRKPEHKALVALLMVHFTSMNAGYKCPRTLDFA